MKCAFSKGLDFRETIVFQGDAKIDHVVYFVLDIEMEDDVGLAAGREGVACAGQEILGFVKGQLCPNAQAENRDLGGLVVRVVFNLGEQLFIQEGAFVDICALHPFFLDKLQKILGEGVFHPQHPPAKLLLQLLLGFLVVSGRRIEAVSLGVGRRFLLFNRRRILLYRRRALGCRGCRGWKDGDVGVFPFRHYGRRLFA